MADTPATRPKIGEPFNPWKRFRFLPVPEAMARYKGLPPGAKLVFGRLLRYAGRDSLCWPSVPKLAEEVGLGVRQTQKYLTALESQGFIRRERQFRDGAQTSNHFTFLWHRIFDEWEREQEAKAEEGVNDNSPSPVHRSSSDPVNWNAHKESHIQESHGEEGHSRRKVGVKVDSPKEIQGERDPVHSGSPKEGQGVSAAFGRLDFYNSVPLTKVQLLAEAVRQRLKAAREAAGT